MYTENFIKYLPEIFHDDFLERFLSIFATQYLEMEQNIDNIFKAFDVETADNDVLRWLAEITCVDNPQLWSGEKLRALLLSRVRKGTRQGLSHIIMLFTYHKPYLIESVGSVVILLPNKAVDSPKTLSSLRLLIEGFLPADTDYRLEVLNNALTLDINSYLGINTCLSEFKTAALGDIERIGLTVIGGQE